MAYWLRATIQAVTPPLETFGWLVLATTLAESTCGDIEIVQAYRDQTATVEWGFRWIKNPAAISPVWLEKRQRIAALSMLTVVGLLVYGLIQRQVRQYLREHQAAIPGNKGDTAIPTATVIFESFTTVTRVVLSVDGVTVYQLHDWQAHHELICEALGLDNLGDEDTATQKNHWARQKGP